MNVTGGCHCGHIPYQAEVDTGTIRVCHCTDCQKLTGTAFRATIPSLPGTFVLMSGTPRTYIKTAESGTKRAHAFCPECGTPMTHHADKVVPAAASNEADVVIAAARPCIGYRAPTDTCAPPPPAELP